MKDGRLHPFCYQSLGAVELIRGRFSGGELTSALGIYQTLTWVANEERRRDRIEKSRSEMAELAGVSDRTLDKYVDEFEALGLVEVERRQAGRAHLPNLWTLVDPEGGEIISPPLQPFREGGEMASPGVAKQLRHPSAREGEPEEEQQEEEPPYPLTEIAEDFEGWLAHHWSVTGMGPPREGTKARQHVWSMYRARRQEGYQAVEIELASEGAFSNDFRRENGHYGHESVLFPTKIPRLIHLGRRHRAGGAGSGGGARRATRSQDGWRAWVDEHFPDLSDTAATQAVWAAQALDGAGHEVTVDRVQSRLLDRGAVA